MSMQLLGWPLVLYTGVEIWQVSLRLQKAAVDVPVLPSPGYPWVFLSTWTHPDWLSLGGGCSEHRPRHSPRKGRRSACRRPAGLCATGRWTERAGGRKRRSAPRRPPPWRWTPETRTPRWVSRPAAPCRSYLAFARCSSFYLRCRHPCAARPRRRTPPAAPGDKPIWNTEDGLLWNPKLTSSIKNQESC